MPVDINRIKQAAKLLEGVIQQTPMLRNDQLDQSAGGEVWYKCENLQTLGSFKLRGAYFGLSQFSEAQKRAGVATYSSGNHGKALALAGKLLNIPVVIAFPNDVPQAKMASAIQNGAEIVTYNRLTEDREAIAAKLAADRGLTLLPPYNHPDIMTGQGTVALEMLAQAPELEAIVVPVGGGGLIAGVAIAAKAIKPGIKIYGAEPEVADDARQSLAAGHIVTIDPPDTIADGIRTPALGDLTFPVIKELVDDIVTVSESEIADAIRFAYNKLDQTIEPSAAVALAAVMQKKLPSEVKKVGILFTGGNIDQQVLMQILDDSTDQA